MLNTEEKTLDLPPDILEHFYDLRALAMAASAMTLEINEGSDKLNVVRRVLQNLSDQALEFAKESDAFLIGVPVRR